MALLMPLQVEFEAVAEEIRPVHGVSWDDMLEMYALYKQAVVGDNNTSKPGMLDPKGRRKWEAWNSKKGIAKEEAMRLYIEAVKRALAQYRDGNKVAAQAAAA